MTMNATEHKNNQELLALASSRGYKVSATQLARWHRSGLLPRPQQQARKQARGSQSVYPPGSDAQFLLLCELHLHERRLSHLAWQLWWQGYPVAPSLIKQHLNEAVEQISTRAAFFLTLKESGTDQQTQDLSEQILDWLEHFATVRLNYQPLRRARKRVGKALFPTFARILTTVASGSFAGYAEVRDTREVFVELRTLAQGLGMDDLFVREQANIVYYIGEVVVPLLQQFSKWISQRPWETAYKNATGFQIQQARDELRLAFTLFDNALSPLPKLPRDYPRWSRSLLESLQKLAVEEQALLLIIWLALRSSTSDPISLVREPGGNDEATY